MLREMVNNGCLNYKKFGQNGCMGIGESDKIKNQYSSRNSKICSSKT